MESISRINIVEGAAKSRINIVEGAAKSVWKDFLKPTARTALKVGVISLLSLLWINTFGFILCHNFDQKSTEVCYTKFMSSFEPNYCLDLFTKATKIGAVIGTIWHGSNFAMDAVNKI